MMLKGKNLSGCDNPLIHIPVTASTQVIIEESRFCNSPINVNSIGYHSSISFSYLLMPLLKYTTPLLTTKLFDARIGWNADDLIERPSCNWSVESLLGVLDGSMGLSFL